jgi:hypothetical protein
MMDVNSKKNIQHVCLALIRTDFYCFLQCFYLYKCLYMVCTWWLSSEANRLHTDGSSSSGIQTLFSLRRWRLEQTWPCYAGWRFFFFPPLCELLHDHGSEFTRSSLLHMCTTPKKNFTAVSRTCEYVRRHGDSGGSCDTMISSSSFRIYIHVTRYETVSNMWTMYRNYIFHLVKNTFCWAWALFILRCWDMGPKFGEEIEHPLFLPWGPGPGPGPG